MKWLYGISLISISLALAGCASSSMTTPSQQGNVTAGSGNYTPVPSATQAQKQVVTQYVPVPVPGQLMPLPKTSVQPAKGYATPAEAIAHANRQAMVQPNSSDFFNAMATYNYMPGSLYVIYTAPMKITDIEFAPGEKIISEAAGDTLRWQIAQTYSGSGAGMRQHLLIKPNQAGLENTVVVTTNERVYHLVLRSTTNDAFMAAVKWNYPGNMVNMTQGNSPDASAAAPDSGSLYQIDLGGLNFNYRFGVVQGTTPAWMPTRIFNDGRQTFIEFPSNFYQDSLPILLVSDNNGQYATMVNWRMKGRYMIIDKVIDKARLESGIAKQGKTVVQIEQTTSNN